MLGPGPSPSRLQRKAAQRAIARRMSAILVKSGEGEEGSQLSGRLGWAGTPGPARQSRAELHQSRVGCCWLPAGCRARRTLYIGKLCHNTADAARRGGLAAGWRDVARVGTGPRRARVSSSPPPFPAPANTAFARLGLWILPAGSTALPPGTTPVPPYLTALVPALQPCMFMLAGRAPHWRRRERAGTRRWEGAANL